MDIEIYELLKDEEPKNYEKVLRKHGIIDFKIIRKHVEMVKTKKAEEEERHRVEVELQVSCMSFVVNIHCFQFQIKLYR